jgi:hypothetical protein
MSGTNLQEVATVLTIMVTLLWATSLVPGFTNTKEPITMTGLLLGSCMGSMFTLLSSAFWVFAHREMNSKQYYKKENTKNKEEKEKLQEHNTQLAVLLQENDVTVPVEINTRSVRSKSPDRPAKRTGLRRAKSNDMSSQGEVYS